MIVAVNICVRIGVTTLTGGVAHRLKLGDYVPVGEFVGVSHIMWN